MTIRTVWAFVILAATGSLAQEGNRFSLSGGVQLRQISADFSAPSPGGLPTWMSLHGTEGGQGALTLYDGVTPRLEYADGALTFDPTWTPVDGTVYLGFERVDQIGTDPVNGYDTITFSSRRSIMSSHVATEGLDADDDAWVAQPMLRASWTLMSRERLSFGLLAGYALAGADLSSGRRTTATQTLVRHDLSGRFEYNVDPLVMFTPSPPFEAPGDGSAWVIYDPGLYNAHWPGSDAQAPTASVGGPRQVVDRLIAWSQADLDVTLHELFFGVTLAGQPAGRLTLSLLAGPTVNFLTWDLKGTTSWESETTGAVLRSTRDDDSDTEVVIGGAADLAARLDLNAGGRFYLEASAGYRWVEPVKAEAGSFRADIDAAGFTAGAALGMRL